MPLSSRTWLNLGLLILIGVLVLVAVYEPGREPPPAAPRLTALSTEQVTRIRIARTGGEDILLEKENGRWLMRQPLAIEANTFRAKALAQATEAESRGRLDTVALDLKAFGLDPPTARLWLNDVELDFGGTAPLDRKRYVKVGDTVHLVDDRFQFHLKAAAPDFVSPALLPPGAYPSRIELPALVLQLAEDGTWHTQADRPEPPSDDLLALVDAWRHAEALWVRTYQPGDTQGEVSLQFKNQEAPLRFSIMSRTPELVLARPELGLQYHLAGDAAQRLLELPSPDPESTPEPAGEATAGE